MNGKLFFIVPVYRAEQYLHRCVHSVLAQSYHHVELILVDDGSPDHCPALCDDYARRYRQVRVIHKENGGLSDARNAGLQAVLDTASQEDFLTFLDADDFVHPAFADTLLALCERHACEIAQCGYKKGAAGGNFDHEAKSPAVRFAGAADALLGYTLKSQCCAKLYQANLFAGIRFPAGVLNEDEFVTYRIVSRAKNVVFTTEKLYYYVQRGDSIMDGIARNLKGNPHRYDFLKAYRQRAVFFRSCGQIEQVQKTYEKICIDLILRYCEQRRLPKRDRVGECTNGRYLLIYRKYFWRMIQRRGMPILRRMIYGCFYVFPYSAVLAGKWFPLRK